MEKDEIFETEFEEEQRLIRNIKPNLRYKQGDVVYSKADTEKTNPMVVFSLLELDFDEDYLLSWFSAKGELQKEFFFDNILQ